MLLTRRPAESYGLMGGQGELFTNEESLGAMFLVIPTKLYAELDCPDELEISINLPADPLADGPSDFECGGIR